MNLRQIFHSFLAVISLLSIGFLGVVIFCHERMICAIDMHITSELITGVYFFGLAFGIMFGILIAGVRKMNRVCNKSSPSENTSIRKTATLQEIRWGFAVLLLLFLIGFFILVHAFVQEDKLGMATLLYVCGVFFGMSLVSATMRYDQIAGSVRRIRVSA